MNLHNLRLSLANVAPRATSAKTLPVNNVGIAYKRDENGKETSAIEWYTVTCGVNRGDNLKIKFPPIPSIEEKFKELQKQLANDFLVEISFTALKLTPYALKKQDGTVLSGVVGKADDFSIVSSIADEINIDDIDITP